MAASADLSTTGLSTTGTWLSITSRSCLMSEQFFSCGSEVDEHPAGTGALPRGVGDPRLNKQRDSSSSRENEPKNEQSPLLAAEAQDDMTSRNDNPSAVAAAQLPSATNTPIVTTRATCTAPLIRSSSRASRVETSRWRWLMLVIFALNMAVSSMVTSTFTSSHCMLEHYYSGWESWVRHLAVYDTVVKALLLLPSAWMLVRYELKFTVVFASSATALGTALRLIGASKQLLNLKEQFLGVLFMCAVYMYVEGLHVHIVCILCASS